ncbi:MAG: hypothetical protein R3A79_15120 [Nannocystaceae bacterium]
MRTPPNAAAPALVGLRRRAGALRLACALLLVGGCAHKREVAERERREHVLRDAAARLGCREDQVALDVEGCGPRGDRCDLYVARCSLAMATYVRVPRSSGPPRLESQTYVAGCFEGATCCDGVWRCNNGAGEPSCPKEQIDASPCR